MKPRKKPVTMFDVIELMGQKYAHGGPFPEPCRYKFDNVLNTRPVSGVVINSSPNTAPVPAPVVVGRVWIEYPADDPRNPCLWTIYNAATGKMLLDVMEMRIDVKIGSYTLAHIRRVNSSVFDTYELVKKPACFATGILEMPEVIKVPPSTIVSAPKCPECAGTGYYTSPMTAKRSPCSLGCKP